MSETFEFKDRVSTNSDHRKLTFIGTHTGLPDSVVVKVERADENVTEAGTPLNAATMNALKESIANSAASIATTAASEAAAAKTAANTAKTEAQTAKTAAQTAASEAAAAKTAANTAKTEAQTAKTAAQTAASRAETAAERADMIGVFTTGEVTDLYDFFSEVSAWATTHDHQAKVVLTGDFTRYELSNLQFIGNTKYTFRCHSVLNGISIGDTNKLTFVQSQMSAVDSAPFEFSNCSDLRIEDSVISGSQYALSFVKCSSVVVKDTKISCNTAAAMTLIDNTQKETTLTFSHCRFSGGGTYLIDGSGLTNTKVTVRLIDCTDEKGNPVRESQIAKGNATWIVTESAGSTGNFYIDAATADNDAIKAKIAEASQWGAAHKVRANLKIFGTLTHENFDGLVLKSNINYTFHYETSGRGIEANNISNCSFTECYINCVSTYSALHLNGCTDITVRDSYLINGMGSNTVVGGTRIHFDNCVFSGGTYTNNVVTLKGPFAAGSTVTYTNCVFNNTYETLVNASENTGNVTLVLDHCLDGTHKQLSRASIQAGNARLYLTDDSGAVTETAELANFGSFSIDAATADNDAIKAKIAEASQWGAEHKVRANLKIFGTLTQNNFAGLVFKSNVNYSFRYDCFGRGIELNNVSNCSFTECYISCVNSGAVVALNSCTDVTLRDCTIVNGEASATINGGDRIRFENCVISGGNNPQKTLLLTGTFAEGNTVTFANCKFNNTYDTLIDATQAYGTGTIVLDDCVDGNGSRVKKSRISKGTSSLTFYISGEEGGEQGGNCSSVGVFFIDADSSTAAEINAKITEASQWGAAHSARAALKIGGVIPYAKVNALVLKSYVNYTLKVKTAGQGLLAENLTNIGFFECDIECISDTGPITLKNCTDVVLRDCKLVNIMSPNKIEGGNNIHFDSCLLSGGTAYHNTVLLSGAASGNTKVTFTNCVLNNTYDTLVKSTSYTEKLSLVFENCLDGNGKRLVRGSMQTGNAALLLTGDDGAVTESAEMAASGEFYVDADTATAEEINAKITEASQWGEAHSARAILKIGGVIPYAKVNALVLKSYVNYTLKVKTAGQGLLAENLTNMGFTNCDIECISDNGPITLKNCTDIVLRDCKLVNVMSSNTVENCDNVYFDHCKISGGTAWKNTVTIKDTGTAYRRVTFRDCTLDNDYNVIVNASGVTNTAAVAAFYDCVKGDGSYLPAGKITKGSGKVCLTSASEI